MPLLVIWQFDNFRHLIDATLGILDKLVGQVSFNAISSGHLKSEINGSLPIETVFIVCLTLVMMTWAQRALEYSMFKMKI